jgi:hypothetical protein
VTDRLVLRDPKGLCKLAQGEGSKYEPHPVKQVNQLGALDKLFMRDPHPIRPTPVYPGARNVPKVAGNAGLSYCPLTRLRPQRRGVLDKLLMSDPARAPFVGFVPRDVPGVRGSVPTQLSGIATCRGPLLDRSSEDLEGSGEIRHVVARCAPGRSRARRPRPAPDRRQLSRPFILSPIGLDDESSGGKGYPFRRLREAGRYFKAVAFLGKGGRP